MFEGEGSSAAGPDPGVLAVIAQRSAPGPAAVTSLVGFDPVRLDAGQRVDLLHGLERQIQWLTAVQAGVLAVMDDNPAQCDPDGEFTRHEVAAALRISDSVAGDRLRVAHHLAHRLPGTRACLADGQISYWHAVRIVEATAAMTGEQAAAVESRVLPAAPRQAVGALNRALRRAVIVADPHAAQHAHEQAATERTVDFWALPDGIAKLQMVGPAAAVAAVHTALSAYADRPRPDDDTRPAGARRFDALHDLCTRILGHCADPITGKPLPTRHGQRPHIHVTVAGTTLLGLDQQPAELAGYGPITAEVARAIAADGTWHRIVHDPIDGRLLHYGRTTYQPPAALQAHVIARDRTCTFPHCTQPAWRCDIDHAVPFDDGGTTDPDNCGALCRKHHRAKTHGGWRLQRHPDHSCTWTSPAGHTYTTRPPPYGNHP